jgi:hypothetical protein
MRDSLRLPALLLVGLLLVTRPAPVGAVGAVAITALPYGVVPTAIDESGRVAGYIRRSPDGELPSVGIGVVDTDAVVWADGVLTAHPSGEVGSAAADLLAGGPVVGTVSGEPYTDHRDAAVRWDGGVATVLSFGFAAA